MKLQIMAWVAAGAMAATSSHAAEPHAISVHVLDQVKGLPAEAVGVTLEEQAPAGESWTVVAKQSTDAKGRVSSLLPKDKPLRKGVYRVTFATGDWFAAHAQTSFFPSITVAFRVEDPTRPYHIPLLLSPYGYATYRGN